MTTYSKDKTAKLDSKMLYCATHFARLDLLLLFYVRPFIGSVQKEKRDAE